MKLTWFGHACFLLESNDGSILFDPCKKNHVAGVNIPHITVDAIISSHLHEDHYAPDAAELSGRKASFKTTQVSCFHDEKCGALRGRNTITVVEAEGLRVCHMGDVGHMLSEEQFAAIGSVDVLLMPVGGLYTADVPIAKKIADKINPRLIVPMHYKCGSKGLPSIAPLDEFIALCSEDKLVFLDSSSMDVKLPETQKIVIFKWPE